MFWNGRTARDGFSGSGESWSLGDAEKDAEDADGLGDVLQFGRAEVFEIERDFSSRVFAHPGGNTDAAGLGQRFQPRRDYDTVTQKVVAFRYHLPLVDANTKAQRVGLGA